MVSIFNICISRLLMLILVSFSVGLHAQLTYDYYKSSSCPNAEKIVRRVVVNALSNNQSLAAGILRLHFHDCFVNGCDGSVLLDSTSSNQAEKDHPANNPSLRGFDVIAAAKTALDAQCNNVVSCADILAFAARDSVAFRGGPFWNVRSGRKDGRVSKFSDVLPNLPQPTFNLKQLVKNFAAKNLSLVDLVALSGGHTIGIAHCSSVTQRLFSFSNNTSQDPSLNFQFAATLKNKCPNTNSTASVTFGMDTTTPIDFDSSYYYDLQRRKGLFISDAALITNSQAASFVNNYAYNQTTFFKQFVASMMKMSEIQVITGNQGEIRKVCSRKN